jgi:Transposase DDE domain group 1
LSLFLIQQMIPSAGKTLYILGLPGNAALKADPVLAAASDACATFRAERKIPIHRTFAETVYAAGSWSKARRVIARIEASTMGMDVRTIVTSLKGSTPERLYEFVYCQRGQAENWIKQHKAQLHSDRTSCTSANANQLRLILHTGAYWLRWLLRDAIPAASTLKTACFTTLQLRLVKLAARVRETATRIRLKFAAACPDQALITALFRHRALRPTASIQPAGP